MLQARIAARAFNTPLLVEPSQAIAFLSGLGPRILGRQVEIMDGSEAPDGTAALPARASILAGHLAERLRQHGDAPYPVVDGIAVIEIAGVLIHRGSWIGQSSGQTSYEGIAALRWTSTASAMRSLASLISQIASGPFGAASQSGLSSPNTLSRRDMRWHHRQIASCCQGPVRSAALASL